MNVACPTCRSVFRLDPAKIPAAGVDARCTVCGAVFAVSARAEDGGPQSQGATPPRPEPPTERPERVATAAEEAVAVAEPQTTEPVSDRVPEPVAPPMSLGASPDTRPRPVNPYLNNTPELRARRLARALVSDLVAYNPQKREQGLRDGTLRQLFRDEIRKSWDEYVEQVGATVAESTPHFQDALNDVLAGGRRVF